MRVPNQTSPFVQNHARLRHLASRIHRLGPRPLYELLRELDRGADLGRTLESYAAISPLAGFVADLGGDRLPLPVRLVGGGS